MEAVPRSAYVLCRKTTLPHTDRFYVLVRPIHKLG